MEKMRKKILIGIVLGLSVFVAFPDNTGAKRLLPHVASKQKIVKKDRVRTRVGSARVGIKLNFRSDRRAVILTLTNLNIASFVSYELTYKTNGRTQGVSGRVDKRLGDSVVRTVLFGTCSSGVCRYDTNITNARLVITTHLPSGLRIVKPFRLKV